MAFATITHCADAALAGVLATFSDEAGPPPELLARVIGAADGELRVVEVWQSQAAHDRFVTEALHPALQRAGVRLRDDVWHVAFTVAELYLATTPDTRSARHVQRDPHDPR